MPFVDTAQHQTFPCEPRIFRVCRWFVIAVTTTDRSDEHFYQLGLRQFGAFNRMRLAPSPNMSDLLELAIEHEAGIKENGLNPEKVVQVSFSFLASGELTFRKSTTCWWVNGRCWTSTFLSASRKKGPWRLYRCFSRVTLPISTVYLTFCSVLVHRCVIGPWFLNSAG